MRLLARMEPERQVVGGFTNPAYEGGALRRQSRRRVSRQRDPGAGIAPADGRRVHARELHGPDRPLGRAAAGAYSELVIERLRARDTHAARFLRHLQPPHDLAVLPGVGEVPLPIPYERGERDRFSHHLLGCSAWTRRACRTARTSPTTRCSSTPACSPCTPARPPACGRCCADYFEVPVEIEQFVGAWYPLDVESQCSLSENGELLGAARVRRGGGRRDLGPAVPRADPTGPADAGTVSWIFCPAAKGYRHVARPDALFPAASTMSKCSWCCAQRKFRACELKPLEATVRSWAGPLG